MMRGGSISNRSNSLQIQYSLKSQNNLDANFNSIVSARTFSNGQNRSFQKSSFECCSKRQRSINNLPKSSQREKKLTCKINYMLKEQNSKINELNSNNRNKIKFTSSVSQS